MPRVKRPFNHYDWLEAHLIDFFELVGVDGHYAIGMPSARGDKCYSYRDNWEKAGIEFHHGVAIYLLSYVSPFEKEVRETVNGWVSPKDWVIENHSRFIKQLKIAERMS